MRRSWKDVVRDLVETHAEHGDALVPVGIVSEGEVHGSWVVNTCADVLESEGPPTGKSVRRWLWEHREARAFRRPGGLLWSCTRDGRSVVGYGSFVPEEMAARYERMRSHGSS